MYSAAALRVSTLLGLRSRGMRGTRVFSFEKPLFRFLICQGGNKSSYGPGGGRMDTLGLNWAAPSLQTGLLSGETEARPGAMVLGAPR